MDSPLTAIVAMCGNRCRTTARNSNPDMRGIFKSEMPSRRGLVGSAYFNGLFLFPPLEIQGSRSMISSIAKPAACNKPLTPPKSSTRAEERTSLRGNAVNENHCPQCQRRIIGGGILMPHSPIPSCLVNIPVPRLVRQPSESIMQTVSCWRLEQSRRCFIRYDWCVKPHHLV
jgi:hypothetical protein